MESSIKTLNTFESLLKISINLLRERKVAGQNAQSSSSEKETEASKETLENNNTNSNQKLIKDFLVRKVLEEDDFIEVRVAVVGNVDSGKSTLLGVLTHCVLDDGRGEAQVILGQSCLSPSNRSTPTHVPKTLLGCSPGSWPLGDSREILFSR